MVGIRNSGPTHAVDHDNADHPEKDLVLFSSKMSIRVLNQITGYLPEFKSESGTEFKFFQESILALGRSEAFIVLVVICLCSDGTKKRGGHSQKLYHDTLASFLPKTYDRMAGSIEMFPDIRSFAKLALSALSVSNVFWMSEAVGDIAIEI